jgi:hypothetical protein
MVSLRPPATSRFLLTLDGQSALLHDVDGGNVKASVVTVDMGTQQPLRKQISTLNYEPFTIAVDLAMGKPLAEWINATLDLSPTRKSGTVVSATVDYRAKSYRHFRNALIEEITIPSMNASSRQPAFFTIKFKPEEITYAKGNNAIQNVVSVRQKTWLCSNFRLRIGDLPCSRVSKVDSFTIRQSVSAQALGNVHDGGSDRTTVEFPNLKVTFSAVDLDPWHDWFTDFVILGNNGPEKAVRGALEFLAPSVTDVLGAVELSQVGIFALYPEKSTAGADAVAHFAAELYVEKMTMNINTG